MITLKLLNELMKESDKEKQTYDNIASAKINKKYGLFVECNTPQNNEFATRKEWFIELNEIMENGGWEPIDSEWLVEDDQRKKYVKKVLNEKIKIMEVQN